MKKNIIEQIKMAFKNAKSLNEWGDVIQRAAKCKLETGQGGIIIEDALASLHSVLKGGNDMERQRVPSPVQAQPTRNPYPVQQQSSDNRTLKDLFDMIRQQQNPK